MTKTNEDREVPLNAKRRKLPTIGSWNSRPVATHRPVFASHALLVLEQGGP